MRTRGDVGDGIAFVLGVSRPPGRHLVRRRLSRSGDLPPRAGRDPAAGVRGGGRGRSVPVRAHARPCGRTGSVRRPAGAAAGPPTGGGRAGDHERRDRGARARREVVPRPRRRGRRSKRRPISARSSRFAASRRARRRSRSTTTGSTSRTSSAGSPKGCVRSCVYTIPDHQNPAGVSLAAERALPLVELARRYGFLVVEDVAYRELGFEGESLPSLWSLAPDVVVQAGTTSKTFCPGVRLGWAVGPAEVASRFVDAKQLTDQCAGALGQRLFEESERRGWIDEQLGARGRSTGARASGCWQRWSARCPRRRAGRRRGAASSPG